MFTAYKRPRIQRGTGKPVNAGGWKATNAAARIWSNYKPANQSGRHIARIK